MPRVLDCGSLDLAGWSPPQARVHGAEARQAGPSAAGLWASVFPSSLCGALARFCDYKQRC